MNYRYGSYTWLLAGTLLLLLSLMLYLCVCVCVCVVGDFHISVWSAELEMELRGVCGSLACSVGAGV